MLASGSELLALIPQRPPMVMIDRLVSCDGKTTVSQVLIDQENIFISEGRFTSSGLMEAMAQTAAARTGWLLKKQADPKNKKAPIGVIGSIKNFKLHFQPVAGNIMTTTVEVQYELLQATIVLAKVEVEGRLAAEAELKIFLTE